MLVVDGVELGLLDQPQQVREFEEITPPGFSAAFSPAEKSLMSGTWAKTLLPTMRSA